MELAGKVVVVTGGASGIGRALALRFAEEGAAAVVVADLDAAGAEAVAGAIGSRAAGLCCDVADEAQVAALVDHAERAFGPVDVFCANAGVAVGTDAASPDAEWDLASAVNVRSHVLAARRLLPGWLERGSGHFLSTASAAGLLRRGPARGALPDPPPPRGRAIHAQPRRRPRALARRHARAAGAARRSRAPPRVASFSWTTPR